MLEAQVRANSPEQKGLFSKEELELLKRQAMESGNLTEDSLGEYINKKNRAKNARRLLELR
ncbi:hypothetical protein [Methyloglobulus sp.]|uniref:hypothetical protein n=1 Tax=Methyloglobulus sp. TaxID=2518622 RepID=UPI00398A215C